MAEHLIVSGYNVSARLKDQHCKISCRSSNTFDSGDRGCPLGHVS